VFLFDEPLSNLDAKLRVRCAPRSRSCTSALQTTMIYVTHDQVEAMTLADRIVVLRDGRIEQIGAPLELYNIPPTASSPASSARPR
jgi:ABC-type sugar transport system ATPase subunit